MLISKWKKVMARKR